MFTVKFIVGQPKKEEKEVCVMNKTYTLKHVIFALREEYLKVEKELTELKKYVSVNNKVDEFNFHIAGNPCNLLLHLYKKKNLLEKFGEWLGVYISGYPQCDVTNGIDLDNYYSKKGILLINKKEELNNKIEQIIKSDFFKNITANNHISIPCLENESASLHISSNGTTLFNRDNTYPWFDYFPHYDVFNVNWSKDKKKIITSDDIYKIFSLSLDSKYLNDYHRNVLDNYEEKEIYIDIDDNFRKNDVKLEIIEEPKILILKPKKSKK